MIDYQEWERMYDQREAQRKAEKVRKRAVEALHESVQSIFDSDEDAAGKRAAIIETVAQARAYLAKNLDVPIGGDGEISTQGDNMSSTEKVIAKFKQERIAKLEAMDITEVAKTAIATPDENILMIDESEFVGLVTKAAQKQHPGLSESQAFSKLFCEQSERGTLLRKACAAIKTFPNVMETAPRTADNLDDALAQLNALVGEQRKRAPWMSVPQAFAEVYKNNPALAAAERAQNRPTGHPSYYAR
jgi:hypothetical protein